MAIVSGPVSKPVRHTSALRRRIVPNVIRAQTETKKIVALKTSMRAAQKSMLLSSIRSSPPHLAFRHGDFTSVFWDALPPGFATRQRPVSKLRRYLPSDAKNSII